ncbi:MAG: hypothetical protein AB7L90_21000 [Hyphomicrobiaceae bacterium]
MSISGRQKGDHNFEALKGYVLRLKAAGEGLPARAGKLNVTAIALACGFNREVLYQNPRCKGLLIEALKHLGLGGGSQAPAPVDEKRVVLERRINTLEKENAALYAEVLELRRKVRRFEHIEQHMVETGRRVVP